MILLTKSINKYVSELFEKNEEDILYSDLLLVEFLTIDGLDDTLKKQKIYFDDLKQFKNLKYLEIANTDINNKIIDLLSELNYLENIVFRDCSFSKQLKNMDNLKNIKCIRIVNCDNFQINYLSKLDNLERLYISDISLTNLNKINSLNLEALDISDCDLETDKGIDKINTNYLVVSSEQYKNFNKKIDELNMRIMVMADPSNGYYIEKWLN